MPSGDDGPLRQGAREGLDWFSVATEASGGGTPDLLCVLEVLGHVGIYGCRRYVRGATRVPQDRGTMFTQVRALSMEVIPYFLLD